MFSRQSLTYVFVALALFVALLSLFLSDRLVNELAREEREKMEVWALATESLITESHSLDMDGDMALVLRVLEGNRTIPVILYDASTGEMMAHNVSLPNNNTDAFLEKKIHAFGRKHPPIELREMNQLLYYGDSLLLRKLQVYPYVQLLVIALLVALAFLALHRSRRAEQNRVWVGLSKETAHQLGTPISSLMAWVEYLRLKEVDPLLLTEIDKDIARLQRVAERFSKIGSFPVLEEIDLRVALQQSLGYLRKRLPSGVAFAMELPDEPVGAYINEALFDWVIENLVKNSADAMEGEGVITVSLWEKGEKAIIDVRDTGKGLSKSMFKTVFSPGYTTKERGWGLGLSLVKRIVEEGHQGKIFVQRSEPGKGVTFRIVLRKATPRFARNTPADRHK